MVAQESSPLQATSERETVIENDVYRIVFTNRGARVKSWVLKKYTDDKGGQLELVNATAAEKYGYPLTLWSYDEALRDKLNSALYVGSHFATRTDTAGASPLGASYTAPTEVVFGYSDADLSVRKTYSFDRSSYVVGVKTAVTQKGAPVAAFPMWPAGFGADLSGAQYSIGQVVYQYDNKVERLAIKKISGGGTIQGPLHWAGISDQYFAAVFVPQDPKNAAMVTLRNAIEIPHSLSDKDDKRIDKVDVLGAAVGNLRGPSDARLYVGPKALPNLESVPVPGITGAEPDLRAIIDFGWLGIIARPAVFVAEVDVHPHRRELGLGNPVADAGNQSGAAAVAAFADEVDAEDAARRPADQGDPGKIQKIQLCVTRRRPR